MKRTKAKYLDKFFIGMFCLFILCGCEKQHIQQAPPSSSSTIGTTENYFDTNTPTTDSISNNEINESNLINALQGYWAYANEWEGCEVITFSQNEVTPWTYPAGCGGRTGTITKVKQVGNKFEITLLYPAEEYFGDYYPESEAICYISSADNFNGSITLTDANGGQYDYAFAGKIESEYKANCDKLIDEKNNNQANTPPTTSHSIPKVSISSKILGTSLEVLKARLGYDLIGPGFENVAINNLFLRSNTSASCYYASSYNNNELYGIQNSKVAYYGIYGTSAYAYVKDFISNDVLQVSPATYLVYGGKITAYVWEMNNGFLVVYGLTISSYNWYDQPAYGMIQVEDLSYLSFIN